MKLISLHKKVSVQIGNDIVHIFRYNGLLEKFKDDLSLGIMLTDIELNNKLKQITLDNKNVKIILEN